MECSNQFASLFYTVKWNGLCTPYKPYGQQRKRQRFFWPLLYLESLGITSIKIQLQMKVSIADDLWFPVAAAFLQTALS